MTEVTYAEAAAVLEAQGGKRLLTCDLCGHEIMPGNVCVPCVLRIHGHAQANVEEKKARFLEAALGVAEAYVRCANTDEYGPKLMAMVTLYRRLQGNPDVPGEVRIAGRYLVEAGKSGT